MFFCCREQSVEEDEEDEEYEENKKKKKKKKKKKNQNKNWKMCILKIASHFFFFFLKLNQLLFFVQARLGQSFQGLSALSWARPSVTELAAADEQRGAATIATESTKHLRTFYHATWTFGFVATSSLFIVFCFVFV
jgi:hypothetical protein